MARQAGRRSSSGVTGRSRTRPNLVACVTSKAFRDSILNPWNGMFLPASNYLFAIARQPGKRRRCCDAKALQCDRAILKLSGLFEGPKSKTRYELGVFSAFREYRERSCEGIHAQVIDICCIRDAKFTHNDRDQSRLARWPQPNSGVRRL